MGPPREFRRSLTSNAMGCLTRAARTSGPRRTFDVHRGARQRGPGERVRRGAGLVPVEVQVGDRQGVHVVPTGAPAAPAGGRRRGRGRGAAGGGAGAERPYTSGRFGRSPRRGATGAARALDGRRVPQSQPAGSLDPAATTARPDRRTGSFRTCGGFRSGEGAHPVSGLARDGLTTLPKPVVSGSSCQHPRPFVGRPSPVRRTAAAPRSRVRGGPSRAPPRAGPLQAAHSGTAGRRRARWCRREAARRSAGGPSGPIGCLDGRFAPVRTAAPAGAFREPPAGAAARWVRDPRGNRDEPGTSPRDERGTKPHG